jgi:hypothetical protein
MAGLRMICKMYGGMTVRGKDGKTIHWVWDHAADEPCHREDMPVGSERWKASERAKYANRSAAQSQQQER